MKKHFAAACLLGTALSAPALAQDASPPKSTSAGSAAGGQFLTQMEAAQWRGSKLVGVDVYGSDNSKIGDINEVIVDRNGQARAIVIGVGGFLGIGEKNVAVAWDKVQWNMGGAASGSMVSSGGQPGGDRSTPRDVAQTTTGSPGDQNAPPAQTAATGGATLSSAPTSSANTGLATTSTSAPPVAGASAQAQDYPDRALISMSKQDLQNAPEFKYASQTGSSTGGSSTGSTGSMSGR
jgi:sporulation protein YlmC with PRC-barrel domain